MDNWWAGMYTKTLGDMAPPTDFELFYFYIDQAPDSPFEVFNVPNHIMIRAGLEAGFTVVEHKLQYPDPAHKDD